MPETTTITIQERATAIERAWEYFIVAEEAKTQHKRPYVYASAWTPCDRRMVLEMVEGDKLPPLPPEALANMRRGQDRERDLISDLRRIGRNAEPAFEVVGEQERFELKDRKGRVVGVGKVDAQLHFADGLKAPLECKSWNVNLTARVETFEDLWRSPWTKRGAYQMLAYLYGSNHEVGFMMLDRNGLPHLLPVELNKHLEEMEEFLGRATAAMDAAELYKVRNAEDDSGTLALPDYIRDADECKRCPFFGSVCNPPVSRGEGAAILTDETLHVALERRAELEPAAKEFDSLDGEVKEKLRGVELGLAGNFLVEGKWQAKTSYEIPKEIKKQYEKVDPKGTFRLKITRV